MTLCWICPNRQRFPLADFARRSLAVLAAARRALLESPRPHGAHARRRPPHRASRAHRDRRRRSATTCTRSSQSIFGLIDELQAIDTDRHRADGARAGRRRCRCATTSSPRPTSTRCYQQRRAGGRGRALPRAARDRVMAVRSRHRRRAWRRARCARSVSSRRAHAGRGSTASRRSTRRSTRSSPSMRRARSRRRRRPTPRSRKGDAPAARRHPDRAQGRAHDRGPAHDLRLAHARELHRALRRARRRAA